MGFTKYPYSVKLLEEDLSKNKKELDFWNDKISSQDPLIIRQAKCNIGGCESRIKDLTEAINILMPPQKTEQNDKK